MRTIDVPGRGRPGCVHVLAFSSTVAVAQALGRVDQRMITTRENLRDRHLPVLRGAHLTRAF